MGDGKTIITYAIVFIVLFFVGGIIGTITLPDFPGRFFVAGLIIGAFGTGAGSIIFNVIFHR